MIGRIRAILKSNKGISLMEIIVAGILFTILVATVIMVIFPLMMSYNRTVSFAEYNTIIDSIGNVITSELATASSVETAEMNMLKFTSATGTVEFSIAANSDFGILVRNGSYVFDEGFYKGRTISFYVPEPVGNVYEVIVTLLSADGGQTTMGTEITRTFAVAPLMLG